MLPMQTTSLVKVGVLMGLLATVAIHGALAATPNISSVSVTANSGTYTATIQGKCHVGGGQTSLWYKRQISPASPWVLIAHGNGTCSGAHAGMPQTVQVVLPNPPMPNPALHAGNKLWFKVKQTSGLQFIYSPMVTLP